MIGKPAEAIKWLLDQDQEKTYEVKEHHEKRSLNANAYFWALCTKFADAMRISKEEAYLFCLKRYGQSQIVSVLEEVDIRGFFKYYEKAGTGTVNGRKFIHWKVYKGSSEYDSKEMAVLIDGIVSEAKELGIETLPPEEIERMKARWKP